MHSTTPRKLRPAPTLTTAAVYASQHTAPTLFGFKNGRSFLEFVADHEDELRPARNGKTVLVAVDDLRELLRRLACSSTEAPSMESVDATDEPRSPDDVLARLGMRRSA